MLVGIILNYEEGVVLEGFICQERMVEDVRVDENSRGECRQEEKRRLAGHLGGGHSLKVQENKEFRMEGRGS